LSPLLAATALAATYDLAATLAAQTEGHTVTRPDGSAPARSVGEKVPPFGLHVRLRPFEGATGPVLGGTLSAWSTSFPNREPVGWSVWEVQADARVGFTGIEERLGQAVRPSIDFSFLGGVRVLAPAWFPAGALPHVGTYFGVRFVGGNEGPRLVVAGEGAVRLSWGDYSGRSEGTAHDFAFTTNTAHASATLSVGVEWGGRNGMAPAVVEAGP
jgi:hypothetical protein